MVELLDLSPTVEFPESAVEVSEPAVASSLSLEAFVAESPEHPAQKSAADIRMILFKNLWMFIGFF
jgi:hypothetical protein